MHSDFDHQQCDVSFDLDFSELVKKILDKDLGIDDTVKSIIRQESEKIVQSFKEQKEEDFKTMYMLYCDLKIYGAIDLIPKASFLLVKLNRGEIENNHETVHRFEQLIEICIKTIEIASNERSLEEGSTVSLKTRALDEFEEVLFKEHNYNLNLHKDNTLLNELANFYAQKLSS